MKEMLEKLGQKGTARSISNSEGGLQPQLACAGLREEASLSLDNMCEPFQKGERQITAKSNNFQYFEETSESFEQDRPSEKDQLERGTPVMNRISLPDIERT